MSGAEGTKAPAHCVADLYKSLAYTTRMTRIAGLPNSDSTRAFDMFLRIRYLQEQIDSRGLMGHQLRGGRDFSRTFP